MSSHEEQNRPGNSVAGLSNLQMRALNDSFSNLINTGLEQIHQRLDKLQVSQSHPRSRTRTISREGIPGQMMSFLMRTPKRTRSDPLTGQEEVIELETQVMSIHLLETIVLMIV